MKKLASLLSLTAILSLEILLLMLSRGNLSPLVFSSLLPLGLGVLGSILAYKANFKSEKPEIAEPFEPETEEEQAPLPNDTKNVEIEINTIKTYSPLEAKVYAKALPELFLSIVEYLNKTSDPMSETLVKIKTAIAEFLTSIHQTTNDYTSDNATTQLKEGIIQLRKHITEITKSTSRSFSEVSKEISGLNDQMLSILEIVANISDVAERIHILSINASIEAARAGVHGRGFKVIADEIQRLSKETQTFVSTISTTFGSTKTAFNSLDEIMKKNEKTIEIMVLEDSSTYDDVSQAIEKQLADFMNLSSGIITFIRSLEVDMSTLSPLAVLHTIITQEIENLGKINQDLISLIQNSAHEYDTLKQGLSDGETVTRLRNRLTTSRELDALDKTIQGLNLQGSFNLKRTNTDIELF